MLELSCTNEQKIRVSVNPVTATGNRAALDGPVLVTVQAGLGTVELINDLEFFVVSGADPGDVSYLVEGDADLGDGMVSVQDTIVLHVAGALAANLGLAAGQPEPK